MSGYYLDGSRGLPPVPTELQDAYGQAVRDLVGDNWHRYDTDTAYFRDVCQTARALIGAPAT